MLAVLIKGDFLISGCCTPINLKNARSKVVNHSIEYYSGTPLNGHPSTADTCDIQGSSNKKFIGQAVGATDRYTMRHVHVYVFC